MSRGAGGARLSPLEVRVAGALYEARHGGPVEADRLIAAMLECPRRRPRRDLRNALDKVVARLRRKLAPMGCTVTTEGHGRGYRLRRCADCDPKTTIHQRREPCQSGTTPLPSSRATTAASWPNRCGT